MPLRACRSDHVVIDVNSSIDCLTVETAKAAIGAVPAISGMSTIITNHTYAVNTLNAIITVIGDTRLPAPLCVDRLHLQSTASAATARWVKAVILLLTSLVRVKRGNARPSPGDPIGCRQSIPLCPASLRLLIPLLPSLTALAALLPNAPPADAGRLPMF